MKILHVNKFFDFQGGAEVYMHGLMRYQEALGHEVHAFSTHSIKNLPSKDERFFVKRYELKKKTDLYTQAKIAAKFSFDTIAADNVTATETLKNAGVQFDTNPDIQSFKDKLGGKKYYNQYASESWYDQKIIDQLAK